jgi:hypothetical protein
MLSGGGRCINPQPASTDSSLRRWAQILLPILTLIVACVWLYQILIPTPAVIDTQESGGQIYFSTNRGIILSPADCVTLRWQVEGIREIYLNDQAQIGFGENRACALTQPPTLAITFQNGDQKSYALTITPLLTSPLTIALTALLIMSLIINFRVATQLIQHPRHLILLLATLGIVLYLIFVHMIPLSDTIATDTWLDATRALTDQLAYITLLVVLVLIAAIILKDALTRDTHPVAMPRRNFIAWGIGLIATILLIAATNLAINPLGMYVAQTYPPHQLLIRGLKTDGYNQLPQPPDIAILGSSRAFTLSPDYIQEKTGLTAYNMAVEGGRIEDILIQTRQMNNFPEMLLIEIQEGLPRQSNDIAARAPLSWLPYMSFDTALLTVQKRLEGLLDIHQFTEALYTARYSALYAHQPKEWPRFDVDGFAVRPLGSASELEQAILLDIGNIPALRCDQIDSTSKSEMDELIQLADSHQTALVFYISPWHPRYVDALLKNDPQYQGCHALTLDYLNSLSTNHENIFFADRSSLESINGLADESGYWDSQHMTEANANRLLDSLSDTLQSAYQSSAESS